RLAARALAGRAAPAAAEQRGQREQPRQAEPAGAWRDGERRHAAYAVSAGIRAPARGIMRRDYRGRGRRVTPRTRGALDGRGSPGVESPPAMSTTPRLTTATVAARIPYANAAPFYTLWDDAPFAVRNLVPRELGREAEAGSVDLGLMAAADFLRLQDRFERLEPAMGVAAFGAVNSVLLFSRRPADSLAGAL